MAIETKRLYFEDPYRTDFEARVLSRRDLLEGQALILDQTCFYPEGGGQPADRGVLCGVEVKHVFEQGEEILHLVASPVSDDGVRGRIDWETRFDHMQQHSGQHVLSQCFHRLLNGKTVSFHLGEKISTLEIALPSITDADVARVEDCANRAVFENREIQTYFVDEDEIARVPLRKPPQKAGRIRVVEVAGFDFTACGGTHPRRTGEIGCIKLLKQVKIRNNVRFEFVSGGRALQDYSRKQRILADLALKFSSGEADLPLAVDKMMTEQKGLKRELRKVGERVLQHEAREMVREVDEPVIVKLFEEGSAQEVRQLALAVIRNSGFVTLFGLRSGDKAHLIMARSEDLALDLRDLIPVVSPLLDAKGGGRPSLVELVGKNPAALAAALDRARGAIKL